MKKRKQVEEDDAVGAAISHAFDVGEEDGFDDLGRLQRPMFPSSDPVQMFGPTSVMSGGVDVVSHLLSRVGNTQKGDAAMKSFFKASEDFPEDIPVHTVDHDNKLLSECYDYELPDGKLAKMKPCVSGCECAGMHSSLRGHEESGGVILRGLLTPRELAKFEATGENPDGPRLCVLCARWYIATAYFWCQEARNESTLQNTVINWFVNPRDSVGGYKSEYTIPSGSFSGWRCMVGPVALNKIHKLRLVRRGRVWWVDQSELVWKQRDHNDSEKMNAEQIFR